MSVLGVVLCLLSLAVMFMLGAWVGHTLKVYRGTIEGLQKLPVLRSYRRTMTEAQLAMDPEDLWRDLHADDAVFKRQADLGDRQTPLDWVICIEELPDGGERQYVVSVRYMEQIHVNYAATFLEVATFVADTMYKHRATESGEHVRNDAGEWEDRDKLPNVADYKMAPGEGRPVRFDGERFADDIGAHHVVRSEVATEGDELDVVRKRRQLRGM